MAIDDLEQITLLLIGAAEGSVFLIFNKGLNGLNVG